MEEIKGTQPGKLYTIGHSLHSIESFIRLLQGQRIDHVLDVRSIPYSRYAAQFNRENIQKALEDRGIRYSFMGKFFGARPEDAELYCDEGYLDFEKVRASSRFLQGFENVMRGLEQGKRIALMCTEKDPIDCHRAIMVSRAFDLAGTEVTHILGNGSTQNQSELNERLLDHYFPNRDQMSLFDLMSDGGASKDLLTEAYRRRNREIGYRRK